MVSPHEGHEIPGDKTEGNESVEKREDFIAYQQAGGSLTVADFQKVLDTRSSRKHIHLAQEAGISHEFKQIWATSIIGAFGRPFSEQKGTKWLRKEADAFYAVQNRENVTSEVTSAVSTVTAATREKIVTQEPEGFAEYQKHRGSLDAATYGKVMAARYSQETFGAAMKQISGYGIGMPDNAMVEMAARLMTALEGDQRLNNEMWLMPELYILLKRY